jgi:hypothetical protein
MDDIVYAAVNGVDDPVRGYPVRDDLDNHLINVDTARGAGGHNQESFIKWVESQGGIYEVIPTSTPGVSEIYAVIPNASDPSQVFSVGKTVYDPAVFGDAQMNDMARDAGRLGWDEYQAGHTGVNGRTDQFDVVVGGVRFRVYINLDVNGRPIVGNIHPVR